MAENGSGRQGAPFAALIPSHPLVGQEVVLGLEPLAPRDLVGTAAGLAAGELAVQFIGDMAEMGAVVVFHGPFFRSGLTCSL